MARFTSDSAPHLPHHIVQRGNRLLDIFFSDEDSMHKMGAGNRSQVFSRPLIHVLCLPLFPSFVQDETNEDYLSHTGLERLP